MDDAMLKVARTARRSPWYERYETHVRNVQCRECGRDYVYFTHNGYLCVVCSTTYDKDRYVVRTYLQQVLTAATESGDVDTVRRMEWYLSFA